MESEDEHEEKNVLNELKQYYNIKKKIGKDYLLNSDILNVLEKSWYDNWKKYTNKTFMKIKYRLKEIKNNNNKSGPSMHQMKFLKYKKPSKINNDNLLLQLNTFYNNERDEEENFIINHELKVNEDFILIHPIIWQFFFKQYGGGPSIRVNTVKITNKEGKIITNINLYKSKVNLFFIPNKKDIINLGKNDMNSIISTNNIESIYVESETKIKDLKYKIIEIENLTHKHFIENITNYNKIKLWNFEFKDITFQDLAIIFYKCYGNENCNQLMESNHITLEETKRFLVENVKIAKDFNFFPRELTYFNGYTINEMDIDNLNNPFSIVFVENKEYGTCFQTPEIEEEKEGKCDFCQKKYIILPIICPCKKSKYCSRICYRKNFDAHFKKCEVNCIDDNLQKKNALSKLGVVGLKNLGNTCFMNTAIQCLSHCWELANFFLLNYYVNKLNINNPIGYKGLLCRAYASLVSNIWFGRNTVFDPINFRCIIGNLNSNYKANAQQDGQEFLNFLIDGLHEDTNLVLNKPQVNYNNEQIDTEKIQAMESWYNFKKRNQSILIDLFYGLYKTQTNCEYNHNSIKFEPFMSVSVPVIETNPNKFFISCYFIFYDISIKPLYLTIEFMSDNTIMALRNKIAKIFKIHPFSFVIYKINETGNLDFYVNNRQLFSRLITGDGSLSSNFMLMQIDPELFYYKNLNKYINDSNRNKYFTKTEEYKEFNQNIKWLNSKEIDQIFDEEYEEDDSGSTSSEHKSFYYYLKNINNIYTDDNFGFSSSKFLMTPLFINYYSDNYNFLNPEFASFPKILFLYIKWTCKQIHEIIYSLFINICGVNKPFDVTFKDLDKNCQNENDTLELQKACNYPYRIRIINVFQNKKRCIICGSKSCRNCLLPYNDEPLLNFLERYPSVSSGKKHVDGSFYYLTEEQRKKVEINYDFELEVTWLTNDKNILRKYLTEYSEINLKKKQGKYKDSISIYKCLDYFMRWEQLDETNLTECQQCKKKQKVKQKMQIYNCPHFLIIHLKRFSENGTKIQRFVEFPIRGLDMTKYVINKEDDKPIYDLVAVMCHMGLTGNGHYYAICYNTCTGRWYKKDDDKVNDIKKEDILDKNAYVLIYRRRNLENSIDVLTLYKSKLIDYEKALDELKLNYEAIDSAISEY